MGERAPDPLLVWAFGTFHVAFLVAALVALLHVAAPLGDLLRGLDTVTGLALYLVLWATTWWTARAVLARATVGGGVDRLALLKQGLLWGGVNGVCFLLALVLVLLGPRLIAEGEFVALVLVAGIGVAVALVVGGLVGGLFALLDLLLFRLAGWPRRGSDATTDDPERR
ncbi:hypothetical protein ACFQPA_09665 [Halomarina halobia]|uniref:DUF7965 domain-containing protein n=1 Tax=Halomarina halobia TaxID=3033386 RepID=A0ABD6ABU4_9EURY|nr:hypothetical protein [Halomarina sp. PSR21]